MSQGLNAVKEIRTFVENLQKKNNNVNLKNADLENELSQLKEDKKNLLNEITALNDKIKMLKLAKNIEGSGEEKNKDLRYFLLPES